MERLQSLQMCLFCSFSRSEKTEAFVLGVMQTKTGGNFIFYTSWHKLNIFMFKIIKCTVKITVFIIEIITKCQFLQNLVFNILIFLFS